MVRELALDARCPACQGALVLRTMTQDMPFFGPTLHSVVECRACDFRHASTLVLARREPTRHTLRFRAPQDLGVRVVRSDTGTYRIPELGFVAEPAEGTQAFVSNVQGVLERVRDVLVRAGVIVEEPERKARAEALLRRLQGILEGREAATLVLEDPHGNSAIHSERAVVEALGEEEAARLRTGILLLDRADLGPPDDPP